MLRNGGRLLKQETVCSKANGQSIQSIGLIPENIVWPQSLETVLFIDDHSEYSIHRDVLRYRGDCTVKR